MNYRLLVLLLIAFSCWAGGDPVAVKLARSANEARNSGRLVRAYMLFAEATARDPQNPTYRANRDALAPVAKLLSKANVETADISGDIKAAQASPDEPDVNSVLEAASEREALLPSLQPLPAVKASSALRSFDLDADEKVVLSQVAAAYGVRALWDRDLQTKPRIN
ncbi:MAG TPA: hypothetical protein VGE93_11185, partial [Bryobacteraceae bacterium]